MTSLYVARRTAKGGFDRLLYCLAVQCGLELAQQVVVLGDGAPWIWNLVSEQFPRAVEIVDLTMLSSMFGRWATPSLGKDTNMVSLIR